MLAACYSLLSHSFLFFYLHGHHRHLPSFPTRRSSDLADPIAGDAAVAMSPPSAEHWFGTDATGRDVFSRVVHGAIHSLSGADRKSTRLNSSHVAISYAVFCWTKTMWSYTPDRRGP